MFAPTFKVVEFNLLKFENVYKYISFFLLLIYNIFRI